jgi:hypothetical protein
VLGLDFVSCDRLLQAQVLKWNVTGTIAEIEDTDMLFPTVQLGDPVHGFLSYDLNSTPDDENPNDVFYEHIPPFVVAGMVIKNPRDGTEIQFEADAELPSLVEVFNDLDDEEFGLSDGIIAAQFVIPQDGIPAFFPPVASVGLIGPPDVLSDASLPRNLHLGDWPETAILYADFLGGTFLFAEIQSLTLVPEASTAVLLVVGSIGMSHRPRRPTCNVGRP